MNIQANQIWHGLNDIWFEHLNIVNIVWWRIEHLLKLRALAQGLSTFHKLLTLLSSSRHQNQYETFHYSVVRQI